MAMLNNQRVVLIFHPNNGMMIPLNLAGSDSAMLVEICRDVRIYHPHGPYPLVCLNHNDMFNGEDNS